MATPNKMNRYVSSSDVSDNSRILNGIFPFAQGFPEVIQEELDRRATGSGNYNEFKQSRIPWIRMRGNVGGEIIAGGELLRNNNRYGGEPVSTFNDIYRKSYEKGKHSPTSYERQMRPGPGITNVSIEHKSTGGALRTATINWKIYTVSDLNRLERSFLTPGASVVLEWGWDRAFTLGKDVLIDYSGNSDEVADRIIKHFGLSERDKRRGNIPAFNKSIELEGNYDSMFGFITNFRYELNEDGSYDCVTEIASEGIILKSLSIDKQISRINERNDESVTTQIKNYVRHMMDLDANRASVNNSKWSEDVWFAGSNRNRLYVTWKFFEERVVNDHIGLEYETELSIPKLNSEGVLIRNFPKLKTANVNVCLITNGVKVPNGMDNKRMFSSGDAYNARIRDLWITKDLIFEAFDKSETLKDAIEYMFGRIEKAVNGYWSFSLQTFRDTGDMYVVDENYIGRDITSIVTEDSEEEIYEFKTFSERGIVSNVNLKTNLSDDAAITVHAGRNKLLNNVWVVNDTSDANSLAFRRTKDEVVGKMDIKNKKQDKEEGGKQEENVEYYDSSYVQLWNDAKELNVTKFLPLPEGGRDAIYKEEKEITNPVTRTDQSSVAKRAINPHRALDYRMKQFNQKNEQEGRSRNVDNNIVVPLELSVEIDGIGGIRVGNVFDLDSLPRMYRDIGIFQIFEIKEEINSNRWTTTFDCKFRVSTERQEQKEEEIKQKQ